jgi:hypothetical protein
MSKREHLNNHPSSTETNNESFSMAIAHEMLKCQIGNGREGHDQPLQFILADYLHIALLRASIIGKSRGERTEN